MYRLGMHRTGRNRKAELLRGGGVEQCGILVFSHRQRSGGRWLPRLGQWLNSAGFSASDSLGLFVIVAR